MYKFEGITTKNGRGCFQLINGYLFNVINKTDRVTKQFELYFQNYYANITSEYTRGRFSAAGKLLPVTFKSRCKQSLFFRHILFTDECAFSREGM
jgi:hypothetical protein